jgi:hypothetical protein
VRTTSPPQPHRGPRRPADAANPLVPRWLPRLFVLLGLALVPWVVWLIVTLPQSEVASRWDLAWGGFDIGLAGLLISTGIALIRRSPVAEVLAAMAAGFLFCDAWFDTTTSRGTNLTIALIEALCVEVPLALVCLWIARNIERVLADARPFLVQAGFRIEHRRLVAPESATSQKAVSSDARRE